MASCCWLFLTLLIICSLELVHPLCLDNIMPKSRNCENVLIRDGPKRYVVHDEETLSLMIGQSDRVSHRLVSRVLYIFLKEVRRYTNVTLLPPLEMNFSTIARDFGHNKKLPRYMINLEVWLPAQLNLDLRMYQLRDCGNITPPGRWGWFIPKKSLENSPLPIYLDHWRTFKNRTTAQYFSQDREEILKHRVQNGRKPCGKNSTCVDGLFTPERCITNKCALLLASNFKSGSFVVEDIETMELYVEVVWVGEYLDQVLDSPPSTPLVFLDFTPSERVLPLDDRYLSITFPPCSPLEANPSRQGQYSYKHCKYEPHRLEKFAWSGLKSVAFPAFESVESMFLDSEDYADLLKGYNSARKSGASVDDAVDKSACAWMRKNSGTEKYKFGKWCSWLRENKEELFIGGIFPVTSNRFDGSGILRAAGLAEKDVQTRRDILKGYQLKLLNEDGECKIDIVLKAFLDYILDDHYNKLVGILGPACSDAAEPLVSICKHYRTLTISYSAEGSSFSDRNKYPYFFRTIGENNQYRYVFLEIMRQFNWLRLGSLTEDGSKYAEYILHTQDLLQKNGITLTAMKFPQEWKQSTMTGFLERLKERNVRIVIADVEDEAARAVMCAASKLGMTSSNGWVWFLPVWLSSDWYNTTVHNTIRGEPASCTTSEMLDTINGYLMLSHSLYAPDDALLEDNTTVGEWRNRYNQDCMNAGTTPSKYAGFTYDAYWTYAYALDKLLKENDSYAYSLHSENTTRRFVELVQKTDFQGVSGRVRFGNGPSRHLITVDVMQWLSNKVNVIGTFYPNSSDDGKDYFSRLELRKGDIVWFSKVKPPLDGREEEECLVQSVVDFLDTTCEVAITIVNIISFSLIGGLLIVGFFVIKHRYDKKVKLTQKYMKSLGIDLMDPSTVEGLDKWEIPRERVVINRKLGEGAFGTVYGGEAHFTEKGWVAVAVKTLKVGSSTEEKLDFLSEAEVMKRFDHKNIVKLLGVCTKNEPVYTIMEFMLYGDLKTYLLARRHLVNEKNAEENDEISSKRLTSMALDIARALSYLAQLKYVHRDVASRNCLVNVSRAVKLGDFGMTRPMFENDYYKFSRKGMLPVRWMSPESLALGVFTPASDVWSFGVVLYEIITFGSFPFQGLSNNQVLEHVKAGNTIPIPEGVKPQLEGLIRSCWEQDYKKRPQASEIVETIANNPRLLSSCLDVPLSSVQIEDTGQLELSPRKFSLTLRSRNSSNLGLSTAWSDISAQPLLALTSQGVILNGGNSVDVEDYIQDSLL